MQKLKKKEQLWWAYVAVKEGEFQWVQQPDGCFARMNEQGLPGLDGDQCRVCVFVEPCFTDLVLVTIPALEKAGHKTAAEIAAQLHITETSVLYAQKQRGNIVRPTMAESAAPAADSAQSDKPKRNKTAARVRAPVDRKVEWSPKKDKSRWERERERSPEIAALTPGVVLRRQYKEDWYECKVLKVGYEYDGHHWPTLYAVTKAITGAHEAPRQMMRPGQPRSRPQGTRNLCNWSATRFWKLGRYAPKAPKRRKKIRDPRRPK